MNYVEFPIIDYIDNYAEICKVYVYTKDKRIIVLDDIQSNMTIYQGMVSIDHMQVGTRMTFVMSAEDFSHIDYVYSERKSHGT